MKKILILTALVATFFACEKEEKQAPVIPDPIVTPTDYRESVVGNYIGTKNDYSWMMPMPPNTSPHISDTTYAWSFSIVMDTTSDSTIIADSYLFKVDSNLTCMELQMPGPTIREFTFSHDTARIFLRSGGHGGYWTKTIIGIKQ